MVSPDDLEEVAFTVRPQVTTLPQRPCTIYQEISFRNPISLECIKFRNFYCATVTVKQLLAEHSLPGEDNDGRGENNNEWAWKTILNQYTLMKDPHYENDAQHFHTIHASQFNSNFFRSTEIKALRFYLEQPSPNWRSFGLRDLMCYTQKRKSEQREDGPAVDTEEYDPELVSRLELLLNARARIAETLSPYDSEEPKLEALKKMA